MPRSSQIALVKDFEASSCAAAFDAPNTAMPCARRSSRQSRHQRRFRPHHHEPDACFPAERRHARVIAHVYGRRLRNRENARVARRAIKRLKLRALPQLPSQRMFAAAAANEKYVHARVLARNGGGGDAPPAKVHGKAKGRAA